ncbi:hypothetical protein HAX54_002048 [Datura stramonium]|uniref:Uncharacterized protein n=1 Tax=Datura stramonium TaxID=4076 RepID=A0ABS8RSU0_DATST|nr:hypothetical protein [Datura stramonium]
MVKILSFLDGMSQAEAFPNTSSGSKVIGEAQTSNQVAPQGIQALGVQPATAIPHLEIFLVLGVAQPIVARPVMSPSRRRCLVDLSGSQSLGQTLQGSHFGYSSHGGQPSLSGSSRRPFSDGGCFKCGEVGALRYGLSQVQVGQETGSSGLGQQGSTTTS